MLRILIAEDHTLVRAGMVALLSQDPEFEIVGEADNGRDAVRGVGEFKPDIVLMDLTMPGMSGMEAIFDIKRRYPGVFVLVLTLHNTAEFVLASLRAGADGYLLKGATPSELRAAVRTVASGKTYLSKEISGIVFIDAKRLDNAPPANDVWDTLTQREREVLKLVAEGNSNKAMAEFLYLSAKTVEKHRATLMAKLSLHNVAELTVYAIHKGLVTITNGSALRLRTS
jgi:DNA-binding NarL/FixJ family response regulator